MKITKITCLNCNAPLESFKKYDYKGCLKCWKENFVSNYTTFYDYQSIGKEVKQNGWMTNLPGMWKYFPLLPVEQKENIISIDEGITPLVPVPFLSKNLGFTNLLVKLESRNPTGTFKDRISTVAVSIAKERGYKTIAVASSGNLGISIAAYCAKAKIECIILTSSYVSDTAKALFYLFNAKVFILPSNKERNILLNKAIEAFKWFPASNISISKPYVGNTFFLFDGTKSIAFEIFEKMGKVPDYIAVPTGWADEFYGIWKGFIELKEMGLTLKLPQMIASEAMAGAPLTEWFSGKTPFYKEVKETETIATSIADNMGTYHGVKTVKDSHGFAMSASDEELISMQKNLAEKEGILAEASSVAPFVAIQKLKKQRKIKEDSSIVIILSGSERKELPELAKKASFPTIFSPDIKEMKKYL